MNKNQTENKTNIQKKYDKQAEFGAYFYISVE